MKDIISIEQADETTLWNLLTEGNRKALEIIYQRIVSMTCSSTFTETNASALMASPYELIY